MSLISLRQLLDHAAEHDYALPAFNINNMEQVLAVMEAAHTVNAPVIMQASRGARKYAGDAMIRHMIAAAVEMYPAIPVCLHQDHGNSIATCVSAIQQGFTSVMMDGSLEADGKSPASFDYNISVTADVVRFAHAAGASVEGELGCLGSLETGMGEQEDGHGATEALSVDQLLTDPDEAVDFVAATGIDALAVAMGTSHGAYKFTREPDGDILSMKTLAAIHKKLPDLHLVMHGASSVPAEIQDAFRASGGEMAETWGVPIAEIKKAIHHGVRKVNIDTDCRIAAAAAIRQIAQDRKGEFDLRKLLAPGRDAMRHLCEQRFKDFGAAEMASGLAVKSLSEMAAGYAGS